MTEVVVGVDIGTSSSKGVLVTTTGQILAQVTRGHAVDRPRPGHVEMDARIWWDELRSITAELLQEVRPERVVAVGVSGMGPCVLLADEEVTPLRPAILYGVDMRAVQQIARLTDELGADAILRRCGSALSTQAVGPKLEWVTDEEPDVARRARHLLMPSSYLVHHLTGRYVLDHHSASQCTPMYDTHALDWYRPWCDRVAPGLELPELLWSGEVAGTITPEAAAATGLPPGIPVVAGTIDAWAEAVSVGGHEVGDLMLMYGTTMFLVCTVRDKVTAPTLWGTVGAFEGTRNLAAGMATSGAITSWQRELFGGVPYAELLAEAAGSGVGARGLLMLPYLAGERTPVADPDARGVVAGLTVAHTRGDLYRAALEATAFAVRHNIEAFEDAGAKIDRVVAVGGGTQGDLWTQVVSDVTGREQVLALHTVGASYGMALLAAAAVGPADIATWNPVSHHVVPDADRHREYSDLYQLYRDLYPRTLPIVHALAARERSR